MRQEDLPTGIAYGFHIFPDTAKEGGKFFHGGLRNQVIALIPRTDWDKVPDGAELITMWGQPKVKGETHCDMKIQKGYLMLGFLLDSLENHDTSCPVLHCIRCGSALITRVHIVRGINAPDLARVECNACLMWWEEPWLGKTDKDIDEELDDIAIYQHWGGGF